MDFSFGCDYIKILFLVLVLNFRWVQKKRCIRLKEDIEINYILISSEERFPCSFSFFPSFCIGKSPCTLQLGAVKLLQASDNCLNCQKSLGVPAVSHRTTTEPYGTLQILLESIAFHLVSPTSSLFVVCDVLEIISLWAQHSVCFVCWALTALSSVTNILILWGRKSHSQSTWLGWDWSQSWFQKGAGNPCMGDYSALSPGPNAWFRMDIWPNPGQT